MFRVGWGDVKGGPLTPASTCATSGLLPSPFSDSKQELLGGSIFSYTHTRKCLLLFLGPEVDEEIMAPSQDSFEAC